jgi:hypothetical protein
MGRGGDRRTLWRTRRGPSRSKKDSRTEVDCAVLPFSNRRASARYDSVTESRQSSALARAFGHHVAEAYPRD